MRCPACDKKVERDAWLCPYCEHIIDPSVLAPVGDDDDLTASEPTKLGPMPPPPAETEDDPLPDAMILGDVGVAEDEFSLVEGAGVQSNGKTSTFLYYATGASTRVVHPDAIPRLTESAEDEPRTPYEDFILSCIDGDKSVRQIQRASGLQPQEVVVTLLTLMDKGAVIIRTPDGGPGASLPDGRMRPDPEAPTGDDLPSGPRSRGRRPRRAPTFTPQPLYAEDKVDTQSLEAPSAEAIAAAKIAPVPEGFDEDLPSVSDFHEIDATDDVAEDIDLDATQQGDELVRPAPEPALAEPVLPEGSRGVIPEERTQLAEPPAPPAPPRVDSSFSDVWAESGSGLLDAEAFIEDEASLRGDPEDDWGPLTGPVGDEELLDEADASMPLAPVMPSDLEPPPDEAPEPPVSAAPREPSPPPPGAVPVVAAELPRDALEESLGPPPSADVGAFDPEVLAPVVPSELDAPDDEPEVTKEVFIPAKLRPARPGDRPSSGAPRRARARGRSAVVAPAEGAPAAPILDPSLLMPAEPSEVAPAPARARSLAAAVKRGPVQERDRRRPIAASSPAPETPAQAARAPSPAPAPPAPAPPAPAEGASPADSVRMMKGHKLYEQALKDKAEGNLLSARMNMKLALTFDPGNEIFSTALAELEASDDGKRASPGPAGRSKAREYYDAATEAENAGDVDEAIAMLEKAIAESKQPAFLNRLGVVLAMKKHDFVRAQSLIEEAISLAPGNVTYEKNLHKILSRAATADVGPSKKDKKGGLLGFLGRRK